MLENVASPQRPFSWRPHSSLQDRSVDAHLGQLSHRPQPARLAHPQSLKSALSLSSKRLRTRAERQVCCSYRALDGCSVQHAGTGISTTIASLWDAGPQTTCAIIFMTHFADLSSWELAQKLKKGVPQLQARGVKVIVVGLGSPENARRFSEVLQFPLDVLHADASGQCYKALGFSPGFAPDADVSPYLKLLPMLAGIGSPGTIQEVLRGYVGDRSAKPVFEGRTPFNVLGGGYQRPFELATLRLSNMVGILPKWGQLCPPDEALLTQQGGSLVFRGQDVVFRHDDSGILKYTDVDALVAAATAL
ncbi:hypothetical protein CVIRNUC_009147 [Coccomyxa viridis]|uniref:Uncharacterized protein n=1 Tax=Coccomyxa viridis TaxID=1274662 RepID=A0AAV1IFR9_9CHLO|nr:hypothetical protein CVIRNUC_009147 [Coccomyxa viridis]